MEAIRLALHDVDILLSGPSLKFPWISGHFVSGARGSSSFHNDIHKYYNTADTLPCRPGVQSGDRFAR